MKSMKIRENLGFVRQINNYDKEYREYKDILNKKKSHDAKFKDKSPNNSNNTSSLLTKNNFEIENKIEKMTLAVVSSICQLSEFSQMQEKIDSDQIDTKKIEDIKRVLSKSISAQETSIISLSVLKQKAMSSNNNSTACKDKDTNVSKNSEINFTQSSEQNTKDLDQNQNSLIKQLLAISDKIILNSLHNKDLKTDSLPSKDSLELLDEKKLFSETNSLTDQNFLICLQGIKNIFENRISDQEIASEKSDKFSSLKKMVDKLELSSIKRKTGRNTSGKHEIDIWKNQLNKMNKENDLLKKAVEILTKKTKELSELKLKQQQIISELIQENKRMKCEIYQLNSEFKDFRLLKQFMENENQSNKHNEIKKENNSNKFSPVSEITQNYQVMERKEENRDFFNLEKNNSKSISNQFFDKSESKSQLKYPPICENSEGSKQSKKQFVQDTFEKMLETIQANMTKQKSMKDEDETNQEIKNSVEKRFLKTPSKNLNELFQFIDLTHKKIDDNETPKNNHIKFDQNILNSKNGLKDQIYRHSKSASPTSRKNKMLTLSYKNKEDFQSNNLDWKISYFLYYLQFELKAILHPLESISCGILKQVKNDLADLIIFSNNIWHQSFYSVFYLNNIKMSKGKFFSNLGTIDHNQNSEVKNCDQIVSKKENMSLLLFQIMKIHNELKMNEKIQTLIKELQEENKIKKNSEFENRFNRRRKDLEKELENMKIILPEEFKEKEKYFFKLIWKFKDRKTKIWDQLIDNYGKKSDLSKDFNHKTKKYTIEDFNLKLEGITDFLLSYFNSFEKNKKCILCFLFFFKFDLDENERGAKIIKLKHKELLQTISSIYFTFFDNKRSIIEEKDTTNPKELDLWKTENKITIDSKNNISSLFKIENLSNESLQKLKREEFFESNFEFIEDFHRVTETNEEICGFDNRMNELILLNSSYEDAYKVLNSLIDSMRIIKNATKSFKPKQNSKLKELLKKIKKEIFDRSNVVKLFYSTEQSIHCQNSYFKRLEFFFSLIHFYIQTNGKIFLFLINT